MRKFTLFLMSLFLSVGAMAQEVNYTPTNTGAKTRTDRNMTSVVLGDNTYTLAGNEPGQCYVDKYNNVTFYVESGKTYNLEINTDGSWVHGSVFVDFDKDGFTASVTDSWKPAEDLVAYSFYNNNSSSDASGWNSEGTVISGDNRNRPAIPSWTVPEDLEPGEYRIRFKLDWCNIDPDGDKDGKFDDFMTNGGQILDAKLVVDIIAAREAFNAAYEAAAEVIAASEYATTEAQDLPLQTTDSGAAYYIWTNAQESSEGPISQLVDGNTGNKNFFHTQWSNPVPAGPHYIEVDLGENCNLDEFIIRYSTRINTDGTLADFPDAIEIMGSNEKDGTYTQLAIFNEGLPQSQGQYWESTVVQNDGYRFLRFNVTAEKTFWHMSEFDITIPASESVNEEYKELIDEIAALKEAYDNASDNANYGYNEYVEATNALTTALAAIYHPFTLNVTSAGWATLYLDFPAEIPSGVVAYIVIGLKEDNWLNLVEVEDVLPANTGVLVNASEGSYIFNYSTTAATTDCSDNKLMGTTVDTHIAGDAYVLANGANGIGLYGAKLNKDAEGNDGTTHFKNNANKAYLPKTAGMNAASYSFRFGEGTTGINEVKTENGEVKAIFDLTGRRVEEITAPGIYIVNGKKTLVK